MALSLDQLPIEIFPTLFSFLSPKDIIKVSLISLQLAEITSQKPMWLNKLREQYDDFNDWKKGAKIEYEVNSILMMEEVYFPINLISNEVIHGLSGFVSNSFMLAFNPGISAIIYNTSGIHADCYSRKMGTFILETDIVWDNLYYLIKTLCSLYSR